MNRAKLKDVREDLESMTQSGRGDEAVISRQRILGDALLLILEWLGEIDKSVQGLRRLGGGGRER